MKNTTQLQRKIMRQVYYTFATRLALHPVTFHLLVLAVVGVAVAKLVHVAAVLENVSRVPVGEIGAYALRLFATADAPTLLVLGLAMMTALSLRWHLPSLRLRQLQTQAI